MKRGLITIVLAVLIVFSSLPLISKTEINSTKYTQDEIQRDIKLVDYRKSTKSNVEIIISNMGSLAHRDSTLPNQQTINIPGCTWPRGTQNSYIYGMGICFGAKKVYQGDTNKLFHISYNPNNGRDWLVSGRIEDGFDIFTNKKEKYQVYFSDEFDKVTGEPLDPDVSINWPFWKQDNSLLGKLGSYIFNEEERDLTANSLGPAIISNQDINCVFKDTKLSVYEGSQQALESQGHPLTIQYELTTYLFDDEAYKDMVILRYKMINMSTDSLRDCWFGMVSDNDLKVLGPDSGQVNDDARYYSEDQSLNLGITWSETNKGELGKGFGYIGNSILESPAVDQNGYIRKDKQFYAPAEQLGLKTLKLFSLESDTIIFNRLYNNLSSGTKSFDIGPADIRIMLATGPFNLNPNDTAVCAFMINFANTVSGGEADGSTTDVGNLITNVRNGRDLYYIRHLSTGVNEEKQTGKNLSINKFYPNPADNNINIEISIPNDGNVRIDIIDLIGNCIGSFNVLCQSGINSFSINTMNFLTGTYFMKLSNLNNVSQSVCTKVFSILK